MLGLHADRQGGDEPLQYLLNKVEFEANLMAIDDPITIVGDLHGQFYDFLKLLDTDVGGNCETTKYVFLGDYVDRGNFSIEVLLLILSMKINRPKQVIMLRGNHECRQHLYRVVSRNRKIDHAGLPQ